MAWRVLIDTARSGGARTPHRARRPRRACTRAPRSSSPRRRGERRPASGAPSVKTIDTLATAAGIAAEWFDVAGKRTIVSPETKIALLAALGLAAATEAQARESLTRVVDETQRRRLPFSLVLRLGEPPVAPLRDMSRSADARDRARGRAPRSSGASRPATAPAATCRTGARSPSARSRCRRCRSAATGSKWTASNAR